MDGSETRNSTSRLPWTKKEISFLRRHYASRSITELAAGLDRTPCAVGIVANRLGLRKREFWTPAERVVIKACYGIHTAAMIADMLGRSPRSVHLQAHAMGLSKPHRFKRSEVEPFLRARNAEGWSESEIAKTLHVDRHAISRLRKLLGLPFQGASDRRRQKVAEKTKEQLRRAGLPSIGHLRGAAFAKFATQCGWPEDLRIRETQILNALWEHGPLTRRRICEVTGMPWKGTRQSLHSNAPEGSYMATLVRRGFVICFERANVVHGKGKGRSTHIYSLAAGVEPASNAA